MIRRLYYFGLMAGLAAFVWIVTPPNAPKLGLSVLVVSALVVVVTYQAWVLRHMGRRRSPKAAHRAANGPGEG